MFARQDTITVKNPLLDCFNSFLQDSADLDPEREILKIEYDFNSDGIPDLAISNSPNLCGSAGCQWDIYLGQQSGGYKEFDGLFFNDGAIYVQPIAEGRSRIYTYSRSGGGEGSIEEYDLSAQGIKLIKRIAPDTTNWDRFLELCRGKPSPVVEFSCNVQQALRTHHFVWKRSRDY